MADDYAMNAVAESNALGSMSPSGRRRQGYLVGALCSGVSAIMLAPLLLSISASLKTPEEASSIPPTYFTHHLNFESYQRLWSYQAGLPTYLFNSGGAALMTIAICLALTIPAGYALARFSLPGKEFIFVFLLLSLIVPYQSLLTPLFFMFAQLHLTNTLVGLAIVHATIQIPFSVYVMRNSFEAVPREIEEAAVMDGASSWQVLCYICLPAIRPAIVTVSLFAFIASWNEFLGALVIMNRSATFTLPLDARKRQTGNQHRRHGLGHAAGRNYDIDRSLRALLLAPAKILCLRVHERRREMTTRSRDG